MVVFHKGRKLGRRGLRDVAGIAANKGEGGSVECSPPPLGGAADHGVDELDRCTVFFNHNVPGVAKAGPCDVGAGFELSTNSAAGGRLMAISVCKFPVVELPPQELKQLGRLE